LEFGSRELDPCDRDVVGRESWHASRPLLAELLKMLPVTPLGIVR
jgi:hypothetical protein